MPSLKLARADSFTTRTVTFLCVSCLMVGSAFGQTLSPGKVLGRYRQYVWQDSHGLPVNTINDIVRTRDGYLWLATDDGAVRFDGVRFTVFDATTTPEMSSIQIRVLEEDHAGHLWMGTLGGGLIRRTGDRFTRYTTKEGLSDDYVVSLLQDRAGNLWIGTLGGGLNLLRDGRFVAYTTKDGLPANSVLALAEDAAGDLWIGTSHGLSRLKDGRFTTYTTRNGLPGNVVAALCWSRSGDLWVGTDGNGLSRFRDGRFTVYGRPNGLMSNRVSSLYEDRENALWIGTEGGGLFRYRDGRFAAFTMWEGLPSNFVRRIYEDPDGDLWLGTEGGGVSQFREGPFGVYTETDGLANDNAITVFEDAAGNVWVGTFAGLNRYKDGVFTTYTTQDGLPYNLIVAISATSDGSLWMGSVEGRGLCRFKDGRFTTYTTTEGLSSNNVYVVLGDRAGNLWAGTTDGGLNLFRHGQFTAYTTRDGLANNDVRSLYEDRAGNVWIGTSGGLSRFRDGRFTTWTTKDGLPAGRPVSLYSDHTGTLWMGTWGQGLIRFKDGVFTTIRTEDGLYDNVAHQILEDDDGNLWMGSDKGIYRASLEELNEFAEGRRAKITSVAYGVADGMLSRECNGGKPGGWKTRDGRLWFATIKGVVVVDPRRRNWKPPRVAIERVLLDRQPFAADQVIRMRPGQDNLEIQYTDLSWSRPQQVTFKYRLAGLDRDWVDAGTRRTAYYSHVPPGNYTFRVIADNGESIWNTEGQSFRVIVLPPFYRTSWFLTLALFGMAGLVGLVWRRRVSQLQRAHAAQQAFSRALIASQESERKRIAAELHDSLGQRLVIIRNLTLMVLNGATRDGAREQIDEISAEASQALGEVREISYNLRPHLLDRLGLTKAVEGLVQKAAAASTIAFATEIDDIDGVFPKGAEINFYRVAQESVNNILKHSAATEASLTVRRSAGRILLTVRDNGKGFDPGATQRVSRSGGFGLAGISERAALLGGHATIQSTFGEGTTITIRIDQRSVPDGH